MYLTARNKERGEAALQSLLQDKQLLQAKALSKDGGLTEIKYQSLDISQTKSIQEFRTFLEGEHPQGIDVLINNAGIAMDGFSRLRGLPARRNSRLTYRQTRTSSRRRSSVTTTAHSRRAKTCCRCSSRTGGS